MLEDTRQRLEEACTQAEEIGLDIFEVLHKSFYRTSLSVKINDQEEDVKKAGHTVDNKRHEAIQARQDRQVIEKLKDKHLLDFRREAEVREQKEVDELALYAHQRRNKRIHSSTV